MNLLRPRLIIITGALVIGVVATSAYYFLAPVRKSVIEREMQVVSENFAIGDLNPSIESLEKILTQNLSNDDRVRVLIALATLYSQQGSLNFNEKESATKAILLLEEVYKRLSPRNDNPPTFKDGQNKCPNCQSSNYHKKGIDWFKGEKSHRARCQDCGKHFYIKL